MYKWLIVIAVFFALAGCKKTDDIATTIQKQAAIDDKIIADYITANKLNAVHVGAPKTDTIGVWYIIEDAGTNPALYTTSTSVTVGFKGRYLKNGQLTEFTNTGNAHPAFIIGSVIKGWQLGLLNAKINTGGTLRIIMASRYGYGPYPQTQYGLPANSILDFELQIFDVTN
ncbi:FKBP-type peptidyl-prolyl cis-trans isomerase [Mucilaginibacter sp. RS28]|uniref:Peptidyl-prolyl cis-trans isomerase n=1 Tax=Mucilaginibacter straminoryzae TaxID=2932774 RepID=A0A9X1X5D3_9SPHI|nr:FKBP-type peptidyl-prolyl cis-trans isomerase [Mucilaginibacter straminoryzae]MCJ8210370.1 FKBP-type peptidyl-prolyl cis-trans isomerase [Mucilaginibacter straminoryzae]